MVPPLLLHFGLLPESARKIANNFFSGYDFTSLLIPSLIVGSILAMKRDILIKAGLRFFVPMVGTLVTVILFTGILGWVTGYGFIGGALFIAGPIMGAGMGMAAIPMSEIYSNLTGKPTSDFLPILSASIMLANIMTILAAAVLAALGKKNPDMFFKGFSGEGRVLRGQGNDMDGEAITDKDEDTEGTLYRDLGIGFLTSGAFYAFGRILAGYMPIAHTYLWMVIIASACKVFQLVSSDIEFGCGQWNKFITKVLTPAMLASIGLGVIDITKVLALLVDMRFLGLCVATVLLSIIIAGVLGYLMGFFFVESAIMAGIGLADMGGTGDIAVLTASNRMHLLPFLQISSRIGGALDIFFMTLLAGWLL